MRSKKLQKSLGGMDGSSVFGKNKLRQYNRKPGHGRDVPFHRFIAGNALLKTKNYIFLWPFFGALGFIHFKVGYLLNSIHNRTAEAVEAVLLALDIAADY